MRIKLTSVFVNDQDKALQFYTETLGFVKKADFPVGEFKWLTVVSPEAPDEVELLLEPNDNPTAQLFQAAIYEQGIAAASFFVDDIASEYARLQRLGVVFMTEPTPVPGSTIAMFDDTCGNLIQLVALSSD